MNVDFQQRMHKTLRKKYVKTFFKKNLEF